MEYEIWTRKLATLRLKKGLTQNEVALGLGISRPHYTAIENGQTVVNYTQLYNLAKVLGLTMTALMQMKGVAPIIRTPRAPMRKGRRSSRAKGTRIIMCPNCNGGRVTGPPAKFVICRYCGKSVFIPRKKK
jgi:DNA-binding XRE family transcriptional regulator